MRVGPTSSMPGLAWAAALLLTGLQPAWAQTANPQIECKNGRCANNATAPGWFSTTPDYRAIYAIDLVSIDQGCSAAIPSGQTKLVVPKESRFRETKDREAQTAESVIVDVYQVEQRDNDAAKAEAAYFLKAHKMCLKGAHAVPRSHYRRIGGLNTGILVVPFKLRRGDIFSDSTIGPYISYKWEVIELLATAGLSQISTVENGSGTDIKSESGLTAAAGLNFSISKDWDIALIVGADRLSGKAGRDWKYQSKPWVSFAIGFNFTR